MPTYEYLCERHGKRPVRFEVLRPMSESSLPAPCPECGLDSQRVMSPCTYKLNLNQMMGKLPAKEAPNDRGFHPEWDS